MPAKPTGPTRLPASDNVLEVLAYWIRFLRVEKGWSQERLAHESGVDRTYVSAVERQVWNIAIKNIEKLANALGVPPWVLLKPPDESKPAAKPRAGKAKAAPTQEAAARKRSRVKSL